MTMLLLKRNLVALDRDVIFLAEAGEEGDTEFGIAFMVEQHSDAIDAEYCIAEGGSVDACRGDLRYVGVQTAEKFSKGSTLSRTASRAMARVPLESNPIRELARAITPHAVAAARGSGRGYALIFRPVRPRSSRARPRALSRRAEHRSCRRRCGRCLASRERPEPSLDAAVRRSAERSCKAATATTWSPPEARATLDVRMRPSRPRRVSCRNRRLIDNPSSTSSSTASASVRRASRRGSTARRSSPMERARSPRITMRRPCRR